MSATQEAFELLEECRALLREYEAYHRAKIDLGGTSQKAERNAELAQRIEDFFANL